jgi:aspartyl aminopeptidase
MATSLAQEACAFLDNSPTPFHLCAEASKMLLAAGFTALSETDAWGPLIKPGGSYFYVPNGSTLVAWTVGPAYTSGNGFAVVGAHTDSPVLKLKPVSKKTAHGYLQMAVEAYGGGLWHTWFDRELTLAGCVIVKEADGSFAKKLVHIKRPLLRVPTLCIHLQSADERAAFAPNKEKHLQPIMGLLDETLNAPAADAGAGDERHAPQLLQLLGAELGCAPSAVMDFELTLCDTQPAQVWGLSSEFLSSPRLDNQIHCFTALKALLARVAEGDKGAGDVSMITMFDHEEVGSGSAVGAGSPVMGEAVQRVASCLGAIGGAAAAAESVLITTRRSFLISADVAHAVHPNYPEKHEERHRPKLNRGTVIKTNNNQRYATNAESGFVVRELARRAGVGVQEFMVRNDCPCGTTIGPIIAARTGLRTVDVGVPSLSMHSVRETVGVADIDNSLRLFTEFFRAFAELDQSCKFMCKPCA